MMSNRQRYSMILAVVTRMSSFGVMASLNNNPVTIERKDVGATSTRTSSSASLSYSYNNNDNQCTQEMIEHMLRNGITIQEGKMDGKIAPGHCFYTRCPDSTWLETYYRDFVNTNSNNTMKKFVGISVGCNKGLDAVNTLRMGSNSERFSKEAWLHEMFDNNDDSSKTGAYGAGVCHQGHTPSFPLSIHAQTTNTNERSAVMHCIEPIPSTVAKLQRSVEHLGWNNNHSELSNTADQTFVVAQYAMSNVHEQMFLPKDIKMGKESTSLSHCASSYLRQKNKCEDVVDVTTLDSYVSKYISSTTVDEDNKEKGEETIINVLSIDVEGYDYNVLLGGFATLKQTEYLEFEVHRKGPWRSQSLKEAIDLLDVIGFTCYWAGSEGRLWRLTGPNCFLHHYEYKCWSNVACANRLKVPTLVDIMEQTFQTTLTNTTLPSKEISSSLASKHE